MTWSISRSGKTAEVLEAVRSQEAPANLAGGLEEAKQFERARAVLVEELSTHAVGGSSVSASGYRNLDGSSQSMSISCSPFALPPEPEPTPLP
jgi:hypothetical protein